MSGMSRLRGYFIATMLVTTIVLAATSLWFGFPISGVMEPQGWLLALLIAAAIRFPLLLLPGTRFGTKFHVSTVATFTTMLLFPPPVSSLFVAVGVAISNASLARGGWVTAFNAAQHALAVGLAGVVFHSLRAGDNMPPLYALTEFWKVGLAAIVQYTVNTFMVAVATGWHTNRPVLRLWLQQRRFDLHHEIVLMLLATGAAVVADIAPWGILLAAGMAVGVYFTFRNGLQQFQAARQLVQDMVLAYEARRPDTRGHAERVSELAGNIAVALQFSPEEVETVKAAALVHDVGMLDLTRALDPMARQREPELVGVESMHPVAGAKIVGDSPLYGAAAPIIAAHHERWDGSGYPNKLASTSIPRGARVLAVADAWDALINGLDGKDRHTPTEAYEAILAERGVGYEPEVVDALLRALHPKTGPRAAGPLVTQPAQL